MSEQAREEGEEKRHAHARALALPFRSFFSLPPLEKRTIIRATSSMLGRSSGSCAQQDATSSRTGSGHREGMGTRYPRATFSA